MGRIIGIDFGRKRIGLAVTDNLQMIASPLKTVNQAEFEIFMKEYMTKEQVEGFAIGWPKNLDNSPSESMNDLIPFLNRLKKLFPTIPIYKIDERFTSVIAHQAMIEGGVKKKNRQDKKMVDRISATLILQSFLENKTNIINDYKK